jgi:hypothetical protein
MIRRFILSFCCAWFAFVQTLPARHKILFNRFHEPEIEILIADGDGKNERVLPPHLESEYSPSYSPDGK